MDRLLLAGLILIQLGLPQGQALASPIAVDSGYYQINYPFQRHTFSADGRNWVFLSNEDAQALGYKTSTDGVNWSPMTPVISTVAGDHAWSFAFDGTYFHYARDTQLKGGSLYYRRGKPLNGEIVWSAEQTVETAPRTDSYWYPTITVDSEGHAWIGYMLNHNSTTYEAKVIKNKNTDGTWATAEGFPYSFAKSSKIIIPSGAALTSSKTYWVYVHDDSVTPMYGRLWDSDWGPEERTNFTPIAWKLASVVADGDVVRVLYGQQYSSRSANGFWSQAENVTDSPNASYHNALTYVSKGSAIVTWLDVSNNHIYYREMLNNIWQSSVDWLFEPAGFKAYREMSVIPASTPWAKLAIAYQTGATEPYVTKFASINRLNTHDLWADCQNHCLSLVGEQE